ncbi:MAG TPA: serine/threonine-protein phosphatase [Desulfobulbus sp.]|nr:serine/threonine-protein phosphatase [Desulfobulbus sp.]
MNSYRVESVSVLDIGPERATNQDRLLARRLGPDLHFFSVLDGLGGQPGGEEAAETACAVFSAFSPTGPEAAYTSRLTDVLFRANAAIIARGDAEPDLYNMGTTATLLLIAGNWAHWAHIGDCRLYLVRNGFLTRVTTDHNLAGELLERGETGPGGSSVRFDLFLSQCLGEDDIEPESGTFPLAAGDRLLLCTDGVHGRLCDEDIARILTTGGGLKKRAETLLTAALQAGGDDNIGLILLQLQ